MSALNSMPPLRKVYRPHCDECDATGKATHPYPKDNATDEQLNGSVAGGYRWLCGDCAYIAEHGGEVALVVAPPPRRGPPQRERLFDF